MLWKSHGNPVIVALKFFKNFMPFHKNCLVEGKTYHLFFFFFLPQRKMLLLIAWMFPSLLITKGDNKNKKPTVDICSSGMNWTPL